MAVWNVIDHDEFSGSATEYEKTSIPSSYDHLCFVVSARTDASVWADAVELQFNGDSGSNYGYIGLYTATTTVATASDASHTAIGGNYVNGASAGADYFGTVKIWIPNYANTTHYKQTVGSYRAATGSVTNYQYYIGETSGIWKSSAAINQLNFLVAGGSDNFVQYSTFTLYGINGA